MLKLVSQEMKITEEIIQEELGIKTNLLDFYSSEDSNTIIEAINESLGEIKNKSKRIDNFCTKIFYFFSILANSDSFKNDEKAKKCIKNMLDICEPFLGVKIYQDLFYLFDQNKKELKKYVLSQIPLSEIDVIEEDFLTFFSLYTMYLVDDKTSNKTFDIDIVNQFAELIEKTKFYHLLRKIEMSEKFRKAISDEITKNKEILAPNKFLSKLFFFLIFSSPDLMDLNLDEYKLNEQLDKEKKLMDSLTNRKDEEILFNNDNVKYFEDEYGEKAAELILRGAKETCIHEILVEFEDDKQNKVSFKDFITSIYEDDNDNNKKIEFKDEEIQSKFEEIEDLLISGKQHNLYNIAVDSLKKEIKILYIRRPQYEEEQKGTLINKVKFLKAKIGLILNAIETMENK